jgi:hypothetical protein
MKFVPPRKLEHPQTHEWIDQRSLALERAVAAMIRSQPELIERAKMTLARWIAQRQPDVPIALLEWQDVFEKSTVEEILDFISQDSEKARRLRQSSPFCGILPNEVRFAILKEYETRST